MKHTAAIFSKMSTLCDLLYVVVALGATSFVAGARDKP